MIAPGVVDSKSSILWIASNGSVGSVMVAVPRLVARFSLAGSMR